MRIIAFILEPPVIDRILTHVGEPVAAPEVSPARAPPLVEMDLPPTNPLTDGWTMDDNQAIEADEWPDMDQTAGTGGDTWE